VIDAVADKPQSVAAEIERYLAGDLLFYRAEGPQGLVERQRQHWDPLIDWARETYGANFVLTEGVLPVAQPQEALVALRAAIPMEPWRLGALSSIVTLTGSTLIALALAAGRLDAETAWAAAHVDEDWQMQQWGRDEMALAVRDYRRGEVQAAATVLRTV
jgi:chaperone required for assembly of F1-ATPase